MKEFIVKKGPHLRDSNSTGKMMTRLFIALLPIIIFSFYKNGILPFMQGKATIYGMIYPLLLIIIGSFTSIFVEFLYMKFIQGKKGKDLKDDLKHSFAIFPGLFLSLILPYNTPISILILGSIVATIIGKMLFGGFGNNIFNPALVGRLFVITTYALVITNQGGYFNPGELDAVSSATPLSNVSLISGIGTYDTLVKPYGSLWNFFFGTIPGALGETSALLCLLGFIYLAYTKVIKWKIPVFYIGTVFIMTAIIGGINGVGLWYPLFQILSGGLFFGAVFMATDPVTSPTTPYGQILYGIGLGLFTVIFRYLTPYPEGVLTSILTMNMLVFMLDKVGVKFRFYPKKYSTVFITLFVIVIAVAGGISTTFAKTTETDPNFHIISRNSSGNQVTYVVTQKGYGGNIEGKIVIENGIITTFTVMEHHETFYQKIIDADYINKLIKNQKELETVDTISGATISSTALKKMAINTLKDYQQGDFGEIDNPEPEKPKDFNILDKQNNGNISIYTVTQKSFGGAMKLQVTLTDNIITDVVIVEHNDTYLDKLENENYIQSLLDQQQQLDTVDTISGATISSNAIKSALLSILEDARGEQHEE